MINHATKFDTPNIINMLKNYRAQAPVEFVKQCDDAKIIERLLNNVYAGAGLALIDYREQTATGMLLAVIDQSIWDPQVLILKELAYWVEPQYRGTTIGYRLLSKYKTIGTEWIEQNRIQSMTISKMVTSPDLDYARWGFKKIEETYSLGN